MRECSEFLLFFLCDPFNTVICDKILITDKTGNRHCAKVKLKKYYSHKKVMIDKKVLINLDLQMRIKRENYTYMLGLC